MKQYFLVLIFAFSVGSYLNAQVIPGEVIIMLNSSTDIQTFLDTELADGKKLQGKMVLKRTLSREMNLHLCSFDTDFPDSHFQLADLPSVIAVQNNYRVHVRDRLVPDDPSFGNQWGLEMIMAPEAWDITTGGVTAQGDTIVVAVLETGCDVDHEDLAETTWRNRGEIPGDGIDNDNNGYTDDFRGWNFNSDSGQHPADFHGTSVNGIIGAEGNNLTGVSGVNWSVKRMVLTYGSELSEILEGYAYAKMMRERYNQTNGQEGAFVVATNSSFGINGARPDDFPVWCAVYDSLGSVGILSAVAPPNMDINVEVIGDMPSRCTSEFMIATTNTNQDDDKVVQAGWGKVSVDMGSPGDNSFTTWPANDYGIFGGTSSSVPHLSGAIALLYSIPEPGLTAKSKTEPRSVAKLIKSLLLEGVDPLPSLENKTLTGGRLNIYNSIAILLGLEGYGETLGISAYPNPSRGHVTLLIETNGGDFSLDIFNSSGIRVAQKDYSASGFSFHRLDLDLSFLRPGLYFVRIENASSGKQVKKLVIY